MDENLLRQLSHEITEVRHKLRTKKELESSLARAQKSLQNQRRRLWDLENRLAEESADVEALERLSLRGLFLPQVLNSTTSPSWSTWSRPTICPS